MANSRWIPSYEFVFPYSSATQPIAVSLSQYLVPEKNRIRMRVTALSSSGLLLSRIVLWTR